MRERIENLLSELEPLDPQLAQAFRLDLADGARYSEFLEGLLARLIKARQDDGRL